MFVDREVCAVFSRKKGRVRGREGGKEGGKGGGREGGKETYLVLLGFEELHDLYPHPMLLHRLLALGHFSGLQEEGREEGREGGPGEDTCMYNENQHLFPIAFIPPPPPPSLPPSLPPYISLLQVRLRQRSQACRVKSHGGVKLNGSGKGGAEGLRHRV